MMSDDEEPFWTDGMTRPEYVANAPLALRYAVNPDYLKLMQIPLLEGRFFSDADNEHTARVIVIDESFAQRLLSRTGPYRQACLLPAGEHRRRAHATKLLAWWGTSNSSAWRPTSPTTWKPNTMSPSTQLPDRMMPVVGQGADVFVRVREGVDPESVFPSIRRALRQLDGDMVVDGMRPMEQAVADSIARQRFAMMLFSIFAAGALLLASHRHLRRAVLHCGTAHARGRHPHGPGCAERRCGMGGPARRSRNDAAGRGNRPGGRAGIDAADVGHAVRREAHRCHHLCLSRGAAVRSRVAGLLSCRRDARPSSIPCRRCRAE